MKNNTTSEEEKKFANAIVFDSWERFVENDLQKGPDPEVIEPIMKATGLPADNPIVKTYYIFTEGFGKGLEFMETLEEITKKAEENTPESIHRQHFFIEMLCKSYAPNKQIKKSELIAFYAERITVFIPENCDNIKEIAEKDIDKLAKQGFFNVKTIKSNSFYTVNTAIHKQILEELKAVAVQSLGEMPNKLDDFFKINI